jgi:hypothetical protein
MADRLFLLGQPRFQRSDATVGIRQSGGEFIAGRVFRRCGRAQFGKFDHGLLQFGDLFVAAGQRLLDHRQVERRLGMRLGSASPTD